MAEGFGQSESSVLIANFPWDPPKPGSMGKPAPLYGIDLIRSQIMLRATTPALALPAWVESSAIPVGCLFMLVRVLQFVRQLSDESDGAATCLRLGQFATQNLPDPGGVHAR